MPGLNVTVKTSGAAPIGVGRSSTCNMFCGRNELMNVMQEGVLTTRSSRECSYAAVVIRTGSDMAVSAHTCMTRDSAECQMCPFQMCPFQMQACAAKTWIGYCSSAHGGGYPAVAEEVAVPRSRLSSRDRIPRVQVNAVVKVKVVKAGLLGGWRGQSPPSSGVLGAVARWAAASLRRYSSSVSISTSLSTSGSNSSSSSLSLVTCIIEPLLTCMAPFMRHAPRLPPCQAVPEKHESETQKLHRLMCHAHSEAGSQLDKEYEDTRSHRKKVLGTRSQVPQDAARCSHSDYRSFCNLMHKRIRRTTIELWGRDDAAPPDLPGAAAAADGSALCPPPAGSALCPPPAEARQRQTITNRSASHRTLCIKHLKCSPPYAAALQLVVVLQLEMHDRTLFKVCRYAWSDTAMGMRCTIGYYLSTCRHSGRGQSLLQRFFLFQVALIAALGLKPGSSVRLAQARRLPHFPRRRCCHFFVIEIDIDSGGRTGGRVGCLCRWRGTRRRGSIEIVRDGPIEVSLERLQAMLCGLCICSCRALKEGDSLLTRHHIQLQYHMDCDESCSLNEPCELLRGVSSSKK